MYTPPERFCQASKLKPGDTAVNKIYPNKNFQMKLTFSFADCAMLFEVKNKSFYGTLQGASLPVLMKG